MRVMKNKNRAAKIFLLIVAVALSFTVLVSCEVNQIKGKYKLVAVSDSARKETLEYYTSYTLTMNADKGRQSYVLESQTASNDRSSTVGDWVFKKKELSFYHAKDDPTSDKEEWNQKEKTITLTRYKSGGSIVVYTFKKV
jgi:hypothetical protein